MSKFINAFREGGNEALTDFKQKLAAGPLSTQTLRERGEYLWRVGLIGRPVGLVLVTAGVAARRPVAGLVAGALVLGWSNLISRLAKVHIEVRSGETVGPVTFR